MFNKKNRAAALLFSAAAVYLIFAVLAAKSGNIRSLMLFPGYFLYNYYLEASFYVPVYLFACAFFLARTEFNKKSFIVLILTIIPFLTTGILLRLLFSVSTSAMEQMLIRNFGRFAPVIVFLVLLAEIVIIFKIAFGAGIEEAGTDADAASVPDGNTEIIRGAEDKTETEALAEFSGNPALESFKELKLAGAPGSYDLLNKDEEQAAVYYDDIYEEGIIQDEIDIFDKPRDFQEEDIAEIEESSEIIETIETIESNESENYFSDNPQNPAVIRDYLAAHPAPPESNKKKYAIPFDILDTWNDDFQYTSIDERTREEAEILRQTLAEFRIEAEVTGIRKGPVITMFEILPAPGVKLSRISNLADNIALRLAASRVRIVAPIPGKHAVGIEVPNRKRAIVSFRELIEVDYPQYSKYNLPIILGKDITGEEQIVDLTQTPHLLIAGATGSGKSVCVNSIIATILYKKNPRDVKLILIDPKIVELKLYNDIPHLLTPVITDSKKAFQALQYCICEMEKRYSLLDALGVRDVTSFNRKIKSNNMAVMPLPYIVVVVDEFADLMATTGKELESTLARLAAMSRAVGIHLVLATQRPSIDVITGLIKANIPSRIAFMVASKTDSRIIIDSSGAEMLLGRGDMLFTSAWNPYLTRIQGAFLSEHEVEKIVEKVKEFGGPDYIDDEIFFDDDNEFSDDFIDYSDDPLMDKALEIVASAGKASASYLQRRLKIGYNRAARLVEEMERRGIVGPQNGSKPRSILNMPD